MNTNPKKEVDLVTLGTGVILFCAWTFIKIVLTAFLYIDRIIAMPLWRIPLSLLQDF